MKLSTLLLAATLALPVALPVSAHPKGGHTGERLIKALELDEARAEEVRQIMKNFHQKSRALHKEVRTEMKALHQERQQQLEQVLTEEEMAKLKKMREESRKEHHKRLHKEHHDHKSH